MFFLIQNKTLSQDEMSSGYWIFNFILPFCFWFTTELRVWEKKVKFDIFDHVPSLLLHTPSLSIQVNTDTLLVHLLLVSFNFISFVYIVFFFSWIIPINKQRLDLHKHCLHTVHPGLKIQGCFLIQFGIHNSCFLFWMNTVISRIFFKGFWSAVRYCALRKGQNIHWILWPLYYVHTRLWSSQISAGRRHKGDYKNMQPAGQT